MSQHANRQNETMDDIRSKKITNLSRSLPCIFCTTSRSSTPSICHNMNKSHDAVIILSPNMVADYKTGKILLNDNSTNAVRIVPQLFRNPVDTDKQGYASVIICNFW